MPISIEPKTTASLLIAFREELIAGAVDPETADNLVRDASAHLIRECGLVVRND